MGSELRCYPQNVPIQMEIQNIEAMTLFLINRTKAEREAIIEL